MDIKPLRRVGKCSAGCLSEGAAYVPCGNVVTLPNVVADVRAVGDGPWKSSEASHRALAGKSPRKTMRKSSKPPPDAVNISDLAE